MGGPLKNNPLGHISGDLQPEFIRTTFRERREIDISLLRWRNSRSPVFSYFAVEVRTRSRIGAGHPFILPEKFRWTTLPEVYNSSTSPNRIKFDAIAQHEPRTSSPHKSVRHQPRATRAEVPTYSTGLRLCTVPIIFRHGELTQINELFFHDGKDKKKRPLQAASGDARTQATACAYQAQEGYASEPAMFGNAGGQKLYSLSMPKNPLMFFILFGSVKY